MTGYPAAALYSVCISYISCRRWVLHSNIYFSRGPRACLSFSDWQFSVSACAFAVHIVQRFAKVSCLLVFMCCCSDCSRTIPHNTVCGALYLHCWGLDRQLKFDGRFSVLSAVGRLCADCSACTVFSGAFENWPLTVETAYAFLPYIVLQPVVLWAQYQSWLWSNLHESVHWWDCCVAHQNRWLFYQPGLLILVTFQSILVLACFMRSLLWMSFQDTP